MIQSGNPLKIIKTGRITAWIAVVLSTVLACFWAYWGKNENFHEGWYFHSFLQNLLMMFGQYLLVPLAFMLLSFIAIRWRKPGSVLFFLLAIGSYLLFGKLNSGFFLVSVPLVILGTLYLLGNVKKRRLAYFLVIGLPLLIIFGFGIYHVINISQRYNDNNTGIRRIEGNGVTLIWAPEGPGWPDKGTTWFEAQKICAHLSEDGTCLLDTTVNLWRLPTTNEAVRSMVHHGNNAGGTWDSISHKVMYAMRPDKESPLWNVYRKTIYWWTATQIDSMNAFIVVYNGGVWPRRKTLKADYLNFRAVKEAR